MPAPFAPNAGTNTSIDTPCRFRCNEALGAVRSPHEATCPSIASRSFYEGAVMSSHTFISPDKLARLIGTAKLPALIDVRTDEDFAADPRLIPGSIRRNHLEAVAWGAELSERSAIVVCLRGQKLAQGTAAWLRHVNVAAEALEGWFRRLEGGQASSGPASRNCPRAIARGRTVWVTRARPKIDRIACPWLIRRFIDPSAVFLFVTPVRGCRGRRAFQRRSLRY